MSSFEVPRASGSRVAALGRRPQLTHRSSDPEFSDAELDDAVDMGEHAVWANLEDPIYAEKDVEIFRPPQKNSTLPVYYAKGWLPFSADTLFNALLDARYRKVWDTNVPQLHVVEHQHVSDVMYFAMNLPWPFANRDYVYRRRVKFYPDQSAFVVLCQAAHHADAPASNVRVRVETCSLRMCIRNVATSNDTCDFHVEYEDDTNFSIPNYMVNILLRSKMASFMIELRKACAGYADYIKSLPDDGAKSIPSQVVRQRSVAAAALAAISSSSKVKNVIGISATEERKPVKSSPRPRSSLFFKSIQQQQKRKPGLVIRPSEDDSSMSDELDVDDDAPRSEPPSTRSTRPSPIHRSVSTDTPASKGHKDASSQLSLSSSADILNSKPLINARPSVTELSFDEFVSNTQAAPSNSSTPLDDDFAVEFRKKKIGLHLETDLFSNKVLVAFCEKDTEAANCGENIEPGLLVTSVNGISVSDFNFSDILREIQQAPRPLTLGFTHPDRETAQQFKRFKEPQNVLKCLVSRDDNDLMRALRPLDEDAGVSAVLKCDYVAPAASSNSSEAKLTTSNSSSALPDTSAAQRPTPELNTSVSLPPTLETDRVVVPAGYLVYEIDDSYVLDVPFAEIAHLLRRSGDVCVVTFKAAMAVVGVSKKKSGYKIPKRITRVFTKQRGWGSGKGMSSPSRTASSESCETPQSSGNLDDSCLIDYSSVTVSASNIDWVWEHVRLLKTTERIFSAALLIDRLEAFLADTSSTNKIIVAAKTRVLRAMHDERDFIDRIKERRDQGVKALKEFNDKEGDDEWQFGQVMLGVTTSWKPDENGSVWIKLEGIIDGVDIFNTVSVIREVDLYSVWTPFCSQSLLLQSMGYVELAAYLTISSPFLQRDAIIRAFGINAVYESRCLLLLGGSVGELEVASSVPIPTCQGWNCGRMEIKGFRALIEPVTRTTARTCIVANIDPKCAIPKSLLNFGIKKMAGILLYLIRKEAEKIEQDQKSASASASNEHLRRINGDPSGFYTWLRPIVDKYFLDLSNGKVGEPLSLVASEPVDWTAASLNEGKNSRTGSPRLASRRSSTRLAAFHRHAGADGKSLAVKRVWSDYLHDFTIWPYLLLVIFIKASADTSLLQACAIKFVFTCTCTWLAVPGAFPRATRHRKRARNELEPLRRECVVLAAICDVLSSWALRVWVRWVQCYLLTFVQSSSLCFSRSASEIRVSEQFCLEIVCFTYATAIVVMQIAVNTH